MKKLIAFLSPILLALIVFGVFEFFANKSNGKGALQVTANPGSSVFVNGKLIGKTPLCKCDLPNMLPSGDYTVRLVPSDSQFSPFEEKVTISKSILTVVDRTFGKGAYSEGSIITLSQLPDSKSMEMLVLSSPDNIAVSLDSNPSGKTPLLLKNLTESDHEVKLEKDGYREKILRVHTVNGYRLIAKVFLGVNPNALVPSPTVAPTASPSASPSPAVSKVTILQTPTGYLRVHGDASVGSSEVGRVTPGQNFEEVSEVAGWYEIKLTDGTVGWISNQYAQKQ